MKSVAFHTLGCKVNQTETEALEKLFQDAGYVVVPFKAEADIYVVNTCTVTHLSDSKSRQAVRRARRTNPDAVIVVTGCYAQVAAEEIFAIPEVDLVIGTHARESLPQLVVQAKEKRLNCVSPLEEKECFEELPAAQNSSRTRAFLKVQEGCRQFCSYCIVPYARGPLYSLPAKKAIDETKRLSDQGYSELVLTGVNLGAYGNDLPETQTLSELISLIAPIQGIARIRLSSVEPTEITGELIDEISSNNKVCRHLHIPLQSGSDEILQRMNRKYRAAEYYYLLNCLLERVPGIALTTDVIVGFPGETEAHFLHTLSLVERLGFSRLHVFKYSPRRGTPAAGFSGQVPANVKEERSRRLIALGEELAARYRASFIGRIVQVLFEKETAPGQYSGLSEHYLRITVRARDDLRGQLKKVLVVGEEDGALFAELLP